MINYSQFKWLFGRKSRIFRPFFLAGLLLINAFNPVFAVDEDLAPESDTGRQQSKSLTVSDTLVVTAHPLATQAGLKILDQGGTAADAAVAIQAMLTLVEPQSSGIGGGAFMLYWDQSKNKLHAYDGRETAPAAATGELFYKDGQPMSWRDALVGGRSVGTPGVLKMLEQAQQKHGTLAWSKLFSPAIHQSEKGFSVGPRLHSLIASGINPGLNHYQEARQYFYLPDGSPLPVGFKRKNPELAKSLSQIANEGTQVFYKGPLGEAISQKIKQVNDNPGLLSLHDLSTYKSRERTPICLPYRMYKVCGFPPPTSGGVTVLQIIKLLEGYNLTELAPSSIEFNQLFSQASRLAFADRGRYLADPDFVSVPTNALLAPHYLQQRAALISRDQDLGRAKPGNPLSTDLSRADDQSPELPSTSHFVVRDKWGNAVSMTTSIEMAFGSTLMVGGFLLNNQLTDFSFVPSKDGKVIANRVEPGKRPRSSMAPFMVFDANDELYAAIGSPGGSRIINYVAKSLLVMLNSNLPLQEVVNLPHISNRNGLTELEAGTAAESLQSSFEGMGHQTKIRDLNSGLHGFRKLPSGRWESAVDNRREGLALGR